MEPASRKTEKKPVFSLCCGYKIIIYYAETFEIPNA